LPHWQLAADDDEFHKAPLGGVFVKFINAVRRSSWRALPALHKPPQGGFFTTAHAVLHGEH